jgi:lysyl-tRNA synthetase class 2
MKKALAQSQLPKIFEITKAFRNCELSQEHQPEFMILEWYRWPGDLREIAEDCEKLLSNLGKIFSPKDPWNNFEHVSVNDLFKKHLNIDLSQVLLKKGEFEKEHYQNFPELQKDDSFEESFFKLFLTYIEKNLGLRGPTFVWDYPAHFQALSQLKPNAPEWCERFEIYWNGVELANAFNEMLNPEMVKAKCEYDIKLRNKKYGQSPPLDNELIKACQVLNEKKSGGIALGLDRLFQVLLKQPELKDVLAFAH